jgi:hypothetical protein
MALNDTDQIRLIKIDEKIRWKLFNSLELENYVFDKKTFLISKFANQKDQFAQNLKRFKKPYLNFLLNTKKNRKSIA